jgi:hypothetical protein
LDDRHAPAVARGDESREISDDPASEPDDGIDAGVACGGDLFE